MMTVKSFVFVVILLFITACGPSTQEMQQKNLYQIYNDHWPSLMEEKNDKGGFYSWLRTDNVSPKYVSSEKDGKYNNLNRYCKARGGSLSYGSNSAFKNAISAYQSTLSAINRSNTITAQGIRAGGYDTTLAAYAARDASIKSPAKYTCMVGQNLEFYVVKEKVEPHNGKYRHYYRFFVPNYNDE